jgi:DNA-binding Lrp family transcriptional regulator
MSKREITTAKLKDLDAKILEILLKDGRTSFDEMAKKCKVTKNLAWKRYRVMEKKGIIKGATAQINYGHFGFEAIATLLISVNSEQLEQAIELLQKITEVLAFRQYNSVYNVRAFASLRDLNELDHVKQIIKQRIPTLGLKTCLWIGVRNIPENLNLGGVLKNNNYNDRFFEANRTVNAAKAVTSIDELDKQIMLKLSMDGRASFTQIARQIGVCTETVIKRYNKLRENDSIKVSIQIDPKKIGYSSIIEFSIAFANPECLSDTVVGSISRIPDMIHIVRTSSDFDLQVTALVRDTSESFAIQDQIARIKGITKVEASAIKIPEKWPTPQQHISTF